MSRAFTTPWMPSKPFPISTSNWPALPIAFACRRQSTSASAAVPSALTTETLREHWPLARYSLRYGLTETPSVVSHKVGTLDAERDPRAAGSILPCYDVAIVDSQGNATTPGQEGEIVLYGENLGSYLGADRPDGFKTGDLGFLGADGELFVTGRKSSFIKNRGFRISPERIEAVLMAMNGIEDGRVLIRNKRLVAEVVTGSDERPAHACIIDFLSERLPAYCVPDRTEFVEKALRTRSGKLRRV